MVKKDPLRAVFNRAAFDKRETQYKQVFESAAFKASPAYQKLEVIFALYLSRNREIERLKGVQWWHTKDSEAPIVDAATAETVRLEEAQAKLLNSPENNVAGLLAHAKKDEARLSKSQRANLRECENIYRYYSLMSDPETADLSRQLTEAVGNAMTLGEKSAEIAEKDGREAAFEYQKPFIQKVLDLRRGIAEKMAARYGGTPMDAILGKWLPYSRYSVIEAQIEQLKSKLPKAIETIREKHKTLQPPLPLPPVGVRTQMAFLKELRDVVLESAGWDKQKLEKAGVTITVRSGGEWMAGSGEEIRSAWAPERDNFMKGLYGMMHETGHILANLEPHRAGTMKDQPVGRVMGIDVDEMAAVLMEHVVKNPVFFEKLKPLLKEHFGQGPDQALGPEWSPENLRRLAIWPDIDNEDWWTTRAVRPVGNCIWAEAEKKLVDGTMTLADMPAFHRERSRQFLGEDHDPGYFYDDGSYWLDDYFGYSWSYQAAEHTAPIVAADAKKALAKTPDASLGDIIKAYVDQGRRQIFGSGSILTPQETEARILKGRNPVTVFIQGLMSELATLEPSHTRATRAPVRSPSAV